MPKIELAIKAPSTGEPGVTSARSPPCAGKSDDSDSSSPDAGMTWLPSRPRPRSGKTEVGTVVAFISGLSRMNDPWGALVDYFRELTNVDVKYRMIAAALDKPLVEPA